MKFIKFLVLICAISVASLSSAQIVNKGKEKADSLALNLDLPDRIAFRTNFVDWVLTTPNIGVEIDLGNKAYHHWSIGFNVRGNWQTSHTYNPGVVYNISGVRAEARYYYRMRKIGGYGEVAGEGSGAYPPAPKGLLNKLFSCRREEPKHPDITYYRGLYASYNKFSVKLGDEGKQGSAFTLGFTWGFVKPMYQFPSGNTLDLEMGISAGLAYAQYDKYRHDRESNCYPVVGHEDWGIVPMPVLSDLRVGLVYRLGSTKVTDKYMWRYDCDKHYRAEIDSTLQSRYEIKVAQDKFDAEYNSIDTLFKDIYVIQAGINKIAADSTEQAEKEAKVAAKLKSKADVKAKKTAKAKAKAEAKAQAVAEKKAKKDSVATVKLALKEEKTAAKLKAKEEQKAKKEAEAKEKADAKEEAKAAKENEAAEKQRLKDEAKAKKEAEEKAKADEKARKAAEKQRLKEEAKAKKEAEKKQNEGKESGDE